MTPRHVDRRGIGVCALASVLALAPASADQVGAPPRDREIVAVPGDARIGGRVVEAGTGAPLRRALVSLSGEPNVRREVTTDAEGHYEFTELPAGRFTVSAAKGGYLTLQYGQRRPFEPGRPVTVARARGLDGIDLALPRAGVITGRVTRERGAPAIGAEIRVERYQYSPDGQRELTFAGAARTNDLGEFRVFGLMPGAYVVHAEIRQLPELPGLVGPTGPSQGPLRTFYPGVANVVDAQEITVALGEEQWVPFGLLSGRLSQLSGTVVDSSGRPAAGAALMLTTPAATSVGATGRGVGSVAADGSFNIPNVPPGTHFVQVRLQARPGGPAVSESANVAVPVSGDDLTGVLIPTAPGALVSGRVEWDGEAPRTGGPADAPLRVEAIATDGRPQMLGPVGTTDDAAARGFVGPDGRFRIEGLLGTVRFAVTGVPPRWMLRAVMVDGADITGTGTDVASIGAAGVRVVLTDRITEVAGSVRNARGEPAGEYVVVVLPEEPLGPPAAARFTRTARPDQGGGFSVRALPPGRYVAVAVEALTQGSEWDPAFQAMARASAPRRFTLTEGEAIALDLDLMP